MNLEETVRFIRACAGQMDQRYGKVVFDEWAVVALLRLPVQVLAYIGPREDDFLKTFPNDLGPLRNELLEAKYGVGDFEFARHGEGTKFEAFMKLGQGLYLICNNTQRSMNDIAEDPRWLNAQVPFAELSERVRSKPLAHTG